VDANEALAVLFYPTTDSSQRWDAALFVATVEASTAGLQGRVRPLLRNDATTFVELE
jgi:hypothetical protein